MWRCGTNETRHAKHFIKLFLDSEGTPSDHSTTRLGYAYQLKHSEIRVLELQVRSNLVGPSRSSMLTPEPDVLPDLSNRNRAQSGGGKRRKVLRRADEAEEHPSSDKPTPLGDVVDLRCCTDLCYSMTQPLVMVCPVNGMAALGHIDTLANEGFRHSFYPTARDICGKPGCSLLETHDVLTVHDILDQKIDGYLQVKDRIRLAKCLVKMVLTLQSTPWLAKRWALSDISFVRRGDDLVASLESLHIDTELLNGRHHAEWTSQAIAGHSLDVPMQLTPESSECSSWTGPKTGAKNEQLWSLGIALLQTDTWSKIACDDEEKVMGLLKCRPNIGVRFREITEQCLTGRFRCGSTDLNNPHLESELVGLVSEMDIMVKTLGQLGL